MSFLSKWFQMKKIIQSNFFKNVAIVAGGAAGAQVIAMSFAPVITRIYGPEAFGVQSVFMAFVSIIIPIGSLAYPIAIVLPKDDDDAKDLARLSLLIAVFVSFFIGLFLAITYDRTFYLFSDSAIVDYLLLIPPAVFFGALLQILEQWNIRKKQFKLTARANIVQALTINTAKTVFGWFHPLASVLIVLATFKSFFHSLLLTYGFKNELREPKMMKMSHFKIHKLKVLAKKYYDFPLYRAPQVFINAISHSLPVLILASFFGPVSAGFYTLSKAVLGVPTNLIGKSIADVFYPRFADAKNNAENLSYLLIKSTLTLCLLGGIPFSIVIAFGPWLFSTIFGLEWELAGKYAQWQAMMSYFFLIARPSVVAIPVLEMQGILLVFELFSVLLRVLGLLVGVLYFHDDLYSVIGFSIAGILIYFFLMVLSYSKSKKIFNAISEAS